MSTNEKILREALQNLIDYPNSGFDRQAAIDLLSATTQSQDEPAQAQEPGQAREADGYAYRYYWSFGGADGTVIRFNSGEEVNGSRPIESIPYWLGSPPPAQQEAAGADNACPKCGSPDFMKCGCTLRQQLNASLKGKVWIVLDEDDNPIFCAGWPEACHEHINDAISEHDLEEAAKWKVRSATLESAANSSPAPLQPKTEEQAAVPMERDSADQLMQFYSVETIQELVKAQAKHIERLQEKQPALPDSQTTNPRFA